MHEKGRKATLHSILFIYLFVYFSCFIKTEQLITNNPKPTFLIITKKHISKKT